MFIKNYCLPRLICILLFHFLFLSGFAQQLPIPDWVKDIGGTGESKLSGIGVDQFDNVYVCGNFQGTLTVDLSGVSAATQLTSNGSYDIFIAKYTADGKLIWAKSIGGDGLDQANNLSVDKEGNVVIASAVSSSSIDCDPGPGVSLINSSGGWDALLVKLDPNGNFSWARSIGGSGTERGHVVTTDNLGNVLFVGSFDSSFINLGAYSLTTKGQSDGFMAKYDRNGTLQWAYGMGSYGNDEIKSVKTNANNEVIVLGYFESSIDLNPKSPAFVMSGSNQPYFLAKYSETGSLLWANKIDGPTGPVVSSLAVGSADDIYLTGVYSSAINFNSPSGFLTLSSVQNNNLFVTKYSNSGNAIWARNIEATGYSPYSYYLTSDQDNNVYIGGYFDGTLTFGIGPSTKKLTYNGVKDTFFGKYDRDGNFIWAFNFGSACSGNYGHKIAVDSKKNVLLGGAFCSTVDFNPGTCDLKLTAQNSGSDAFIAKYNQVKLSGEPLITTFSFAAQSAAAVIDVATKTIKIKVKAGTDVKKLSPTITTDIGVLSPLSNTEADFSNLKVYTISSNCINYTWTVEVSVEAGAKLELCANELTLVKGLTGAPANALFQWEAKDINGNWVSAPSPATQPDYQFQGLANYSNEDQAFNLRRKVITTSTSFYDSETVLNIHPATTDNTISADQNLYCNGKAKPVLTGSVPSGAENTTRSYTWQQSTDGTTWSDVPNEKGQHLSPAEFTQSTYFRRITFSDNCQSVSPALKIEVYPAITVSNAGEPIALCQTANVNLNANLPATNETGSWSVVKPSSYQPFDDSNGSDPKALVKNLPENQEIIFKWTIKNTACSTESFSEVKLYNYGLPSLTLPERITINQGESVQIPATMNSTGSYTYLWSPSNNLNDVTLLSPVASPAKTVIYHLLIKYGEQCSMERDLKIIVNRTEKTTVCSGADISLEGDPDNETQPKYQWQVFQEGAWSDLDNANQKNLQTKTLKNFGKNALALLYRRQVQVDLLRYYDSQFPIEVLAVTSNNVIQSENLVFCAQTIENTLISGSLPEGPTAQGLRYSWESSTDGDTWQNISSQDSKDLLIEQLSLSTYFRRLTYSGSCPTYSNILKIKINPPATLADAGSDQSFCGENTVTLNANKAGDQETGSWEVIAPLSYQPFSSATIHDPKATIRNFPQNEEVILKWTIDNQNCNTSSNAQIKLFSYKKLLIQAPDVLTIDYGQKINLGVMADLPSDGTYILEWGPLTGLENYDRLSPDAMPKETTDYTLTISYGKECVQSKKIKVIVVRNLEIPNAFSPNGDNVNDYWTIKNIEGYPKSRVSIFNRYGSIVHQSTGYTSPWDGTWQGKPVPAGAYYYIIELKDKTNSLFKGNITLIR